MRHRTAFFVAGLMFLLLALELAPVQPAWAGGFSCGPRQGSYTLIDDYGIGVSGVAAGFRYQQSPHSVLLHFTRMTTVAEAAARYYGPTWRFDFSRRADGSLWYHSRIPFIYVLLCLSPDRTDGHPQRVYPTADTRGDMLSTNNNTVRVGNANSQNVRTGVPDGAGGAEPGTTPTLPSPVFPWHTLGLIVIWLGCVIWIISVIYSFFSARRRAQAREDH